MVNTADINSAAGDNLAVIIVAAGKGTRFGASVPKQFLSLDGKAVVQRAVECFAEVFPEAHIILVLSGNESREMWQAVSYGMPYARPEIVEGGSTRTESVGNALTALAARGVADHDIVMIHDGARPIANPIMLRRLYETVANGAAKACVPAYLPTEALADVTESGSLRPVPRRCFRSIQTPQTFDAHTIIECYSLMMSNKNDSAEYDDDAAVFAAYSDLPISMIEGDRNNIKITRPADLDIASILLHSPLPYPAES